MSEPPSYPVPQQSSWPGERQPSDRDVELGIESLDSDFLTLYKTALLSSAAGSSNEPLMQMRLDELAPPTKDFTYPLSLLYEFPQLPSEVSVGQLQRSFAFRYRSHPLLNTLPLPPDSQDVILSFFKFSIACLASAADSTQGFQQNSSLARDLFFAGARLWCVMLEVDNREARTLEGVLSPILLALYGVLSADVEVWSLIEHQLLPSTCTMVRRLRLHDPFISREASTPLSLGATARSSVISTLYLTCTLAAIHLNIPLYITSAEIGNLANDYGETINFQRLYSSLLHEEYSQDSFPWLNGSPLMFLVCILSDAICIQRSLMPFCVETSRIPPSASSYTSKLSYGNPNSVLSPPSEYQRMLEALENALDKWQERFGSQEGRPFLALFYFCKLYIACPQLSHLPGLVNYPPSKTGIGQPSTKSLHDISISGKAVDYAWAVLDRVDQKHRAEEGLTPVWNPVIIFLAALVVWANTQQHIASRGIGGRLRQLLVFKFELDRMPWPCCVEMAAALDSILQSQG